MVNVVDTQQQETEFTDTLWISMSMYLIAAGVMVVAFFTPVAMISEEIAAQTTALDGTFTLAERLNGVGMLFYGIAILAAILGIFESKKGNPSILPGVLVLIFGFIPAVAATVIDDLTLLDPNATTTEQAMLAWYGVLLGFFAGVVSKSLKK